MAAALWGKAKNAAIKTKLQGDILLLERDKKLRKQQFGVDLYELLTAGEKGGSIFVVKTPSIFHAKEDAIRAPFEACKAEVESYLARKNMHKQEIDLIHVNRERALPATTNKEKMDRAAKYVTDTGTEGKLQSQIVLLDRQIKQRKEQFGIEVYDGFIGDDGTIASGSENNAEGPLGGVKSMVGGVKAMAAGQLSALSEKEKKIEECVDKANKDVRAIQIEINMKEKEIRNLLLQNI